MRNRLLEKMFEPERWEALIEKADLKGIDLGELKRLCEPEVRAALYLAILNEAIEFAPSHMALIPKDTPGEFRTVFIGENIDRVLQSLINDCLFELFPDMVHKSCKSYQKGLGTGKAVKELSNILKNNTYEIVGVKSDFHHYFDTVELNAIMKIFDIIEMRLGFKKGTEPVMNLLRKSWMNDLVFDLDGNLVEMYCGIRQGNAVASFLADVILYELDEYMSNKYEFYCRYSDDCVTIGTDVNEILTDMNGIITKYGVSLNPKKIEVLRKDTWFKFLGFMLKDDQITLSKSRLKTFQKEIETKVLKNNKEGMSEKKAVNKINAYLYKGDGRYSWATSVLPIINVQKDIDTLNKYVMDAIRAAQTGKTKIGGLGSCIERLDFTIMRGTGKNVKANREKVSGRIEGYYSIRCMQNAILSRRAVYETIVRGM